MSVTGVSGSSSTTTDTSSTTSSLGASTDLATKEMFLKLLVAQIKNQNPLDPADGVEFLSQLAQFSQLEQTISINEGITGLRSDLTGSSGGTQSSSGTDLSTKQK